MFYTPLKFYPPNGCLYCKVLWRSHGRRFDTLHPAGIHMYVEPSDRIRIARMKHNRRIRKLIDIRKAKGYDELGKPLRDPRRRRDSKNGVPDPGSQ